MRAVKLVTALLSSTSAAASSTRCCFAMRDAADGRAIQQDSGSGLLFVQSSMPDAGRYCLDAKSVLWDAGNNACIIDSAFRFQCLDPTPGFGRWRLRRGANGRALLTVDGSAQFKACPAGEGGIMVWGALKDNAPGCRALHLVVSDLDGACREYRG
ncbi:hypothetical protein L249_1402 [Ophiocordyceps polyrhachis-furcata BCC 54312]|uniref:Uncharacterized protein n=1 Tax=Ophiocordyceps polyrhachis-furcata BCC 54312 TaxID=1330021 RepID=A0A367L495_9HYPO|nr:hypothetical protein L249_1402 [Ophiocordyceps polyrhachis-furcata BCC 54312]